MHQADMSVQTARELFAFLITGAREQARLPSLTPGQEHQLVKVTTPRLAAAVGINQSTLTGYEKGLRRPEKPQTLPAILGYLGMLDRLPIMRSIMEIASSKDMRRGDRHIIGMMDQAELLPALEHYAVSIDTYSGYSIPGLLHTEATGAAELASGVYYRPDFDQARALELRMKRKQCILRDNNPTRLTVYVDEWALVRPIGGAEVLLGQLRYLLTLIDQLPNVHVRIVPTSCTDRPTGGHDLTIMRFTESWCLGYGESSMRANFYGSLPEIEACGRSMGRYDSLALSAEESRERIVRAITEMETSSR